MLQDSKNIHVTLAILRTTVPIGMGIRLVPTLRKARREKYDEKHGIKVELVNKKS